MWPALSPLCCCAIMPPPTSTRYISSRIQYCVKGSGLHIAKCAAEFAAAALLVSSALPAAAASPRAAALVVVGGAALDAARRAFFMSRLTRALFHRGDPLTVAGSRWILLLKSASHLAFLSHFVFLRGLAAGPHNSRPEMGVLILCWLALTGAGVERVVFDPFFALITLAASLASLFAMLSASAALCRWQAWPHVGGSSWPAALATQGGDSLRDGGGQWELWLLPLAMAAALCQVRGAGLTCLPHNRLGAIYAALCRRVFNETRSCSPPRPPAPLLQVFAASWAHEKATREDFAGRMLAQHRANLAQHVVDNLLPPVVTEEIRAARLSASGPRLQRGEGLGRIDAPLSWSFKNVRTPRLFAGGLFTGISLAVVVVVHASP